MNNKVNDLMKKNTFIALVLAGTVASGPVMAANNAKLTFTATITPGTCDVATIPATTLPLGSVDPNQLSGKNQVITGTKPFTVNLACTGTGPAAAAPKVTLSGTAMTGGTDSKKLFRDTASTSAGFGVAIAPVATPTTAPVWTSLKGNADTLPVTVPPGGSPAPIQMAAGVACGSTADCAVATLKAGTLTAGVTFTFAYN
ncbi:fimbrial protein [Serratia quinivorans]|uniref:fimbrial protein n=1 Tax=Serratia quinivorans TaxID=137545 RepID=UPI002E7A5961|nr:fimbrial protein [Serratia quinivorans]